MNVTDDFLAILIELENLSSQKLSLPDIVSFIEKKRMRYLSVRNALSSYLGTALYSRYLGEFDGGLQLLLTGVLRESEMRHPSYLKLEGHTLLEILYCLGHYPPNQFSKDDLICAIRQQRAAIEDATKMITRGYLSLKKGAYLKKKEKANKPPTEFVYKHEGD